MNSFWFESAYLSFGDLWLFFGENKTVLYELRKSPIIIFRSYADLIVHREYVLKKIRPQTLADHFRKPFLSQAKRESDSCRKMSTLGIRTPTIYNFGVNLSPIGRYESMLLMEYIPNIGTLQDVFQLESSPDIRDDLLERVFEDLNRLLNARIYHKDAHPGNILVTTDYDLVWINNDLSPLRGEREYNRLFKKFLRSRIFTDEEKKSIDRLYSRYRTRFIQ